MINKYNKTFTFYGLSLGIPWVLWFLVAYLSNREVQTGFMEILEVGFGVLGLIFPLLIAGYLFFKNKELLNDLSGRFIHKKGVSGRYYFLTLLIIPLSIVFGQLLSVLIGHSLDQFQITGNPSFTSTFLSPWFILLFAPVVEELAWHSYGTDTLRRKFNLFATS